MRQEHNLNQVADDLLRARDEVRVISPPSERDVSFDLAAGYRVGHVLYERLLRRGFQSVGRKIGATNPATWKEFNLDSPIWSHIYSQTVHFAERDRCTLCLSTMVAPRIEPEVVLKLRAPVPNGHLTADVVAPCIEWAAIGFEVVDSHYPGWRFTGADVVADFGVHSALVVGTPWVIGSNDTGRLATVLKSLQVTLRGGREFMATGVGGNALGSPLLALCHLAGVLEAQSWAPSLTAGEIITTGTLTTLPYVYTGESYRVAVEGAPLGNLELEFHG